MLAAGTLLTTDLGALWVALPVLASSLGATSTELLWINDGYGLATAATMILFGSLSDRWGPRRLILAGAAGFLVASAVAAFAPTPAVLVAARLLLGVSGAAMIPAILSAITHLYPDERERHGAIAAWIAALSLGVGLGPVVGGLLLQWFWWGAVFLVAVPVMLLVMVAVGRGLRVPAPEPHAARIDVGGAVLMAVAMFGLVHVVKAVAAHGPGLVEGVVAAVSAVALVWFVRHEGRRTDPLVELAVFRSPGFTAALLLLMLTLAAMNGVHSLTPTAVQMLAGVSPIVAGLAMLPAAVALAVGSRLTPVVHRRVGPGRTVAAGALAALAGLALLVLATAVSVSGSVPGSVAVLLFAISAALVLLGLSPMTVLGTAIAVESVPPERSGQAASISQTAYELGLVLGIAVTGSIGAAVYRAQLAGAGGDVSASVLERAGSSYAGGLEVARSDGGPEAVALVRDAFAHGYVAAGTVSAVLTVVLGLGGLRLLRARAART